MALSIAADSFLSFRILACAADCSLVSFVTLVWFFRTLVSTCPETVIEMLPMPLGITPLRNDCSSKRLLRSPSKKIAAAMAVVRGKKAAAAAIPIAIKTGFSLSSLSINSPTFLTEDAIPDANLSMFCIPALVLPPDRAVRASTRPAPIVSLALLDAIVSLSNLPANVSAAAEACPANNVVSFC